MSSVITERYTPLDLKETLDVISCSLWFHREDQATLRLTPGPELSLQPRCFHKHPSALLSCAQALATGGKRQTPSAPPRCTLRSLHSTPEPGSSGCYSKPAREAHPPQPHRRKMGGAKKLPSSGLHPAQARPQGDGGPQGQRGIVCEREREQGEECASSFFLFLTLPHPAVSW